MNLSLFGYKKPDREYPFVNSSESSQKKRGSLHKLTERASSPNVTPKTTHINLLGKIFLIFITAPSYKIKERADEILTTEYKYYDRNNQMITEKRKKYIKEFFNENGKYKIFLTGNSQNEDLLQFLSYSAKELKYLRLNMAQVPNKETFKFMKHYKKELLEFKPDIVVFSISVGALSQMTDFYKD